MQTFSEDIGKVFYKMKFYIVSDDADTCTGLRLAGAFFLLAQNRETAEEALEAACNDPDTGILMITENIRKMCKETVSEIEKGSRPVLVEIPDSKNVGTSSDSVGDYIKATVGINIQ